MAALAAGVRAQLGQDERGCLRCWGRPAPAKGGTNAAEQLVFATDEGLSVELGMVDGIARRATYAKDPLDEATVERLLQMNREGGTWHAWTAPGQSPTSPAGRRWMRSDEMTMATLVSGRLSVVTAEWVHRPVAKSPDPGGKTNAPGKDAAERIPAGVTTNPPPTTERLLGYWKCQRPGGTALVLHLRPEGALSWIELGETERREFRAGWKREGPDAAGLLIVPDPQAPRSVEVPYGGRLCTVDATTLRLIRKGEETAGIPDGPGERDADTDRVFRRAPGPPTWKPGMPAKRPAVGDTLAEALRLLGAPSGTVSSASREILVYPWGRVELIDGRVTVMEE